MSVSNSKTGSGARMMIERANDLKLYTWNVKG